MAHTMLPLSTAQNTNAALKIAPKSPALKNSSDFSLVVKCDNRRALLCGLIAAGAGAMLAPGIAHAASKRRAPPPVPAEEKKDPNVSGVQAKVLASKRRKEAMKEAVAKLREKGKPVDK
ncbi:hypothetical protein BS78_02G242600 [Paspalum vaginatum]|nr:hypothetical protein BS78_02G242600 [Paspalum vaginatum]KAJ1290430.1 hypothetical protein BS78_02G242600 [Paspalum vaginatum]KAJ1290431.1 hypothetical protein BS78_02G242600 [Paspalum vaginatum]KAJ1290432.1 hypothetical protein BS78_02G242600 [Paspalum vaginatum]KAJ1290433.1 hypothetical protein BS78_02G242600 [Paspalum vaginatum]